MRRSVFSIFLFLILALQASAYKKQEINITVNGQSRNMVVFTPSTLPAKSPLFIVTHGMNQDPEYQYGADKMYEMIDTAKFVITYLRSDGSTWDTGGTKDQNFVISTIDEMEKRFDIDTNRVYWSGFSMGSMLIHHCIANMQDKIAAFAPTSGIQFSEQPWNNCKKPVNLLECIAYDDNVFGYEQYGIHDYIENYAKHDNHTNYTKTANYKPISSSWYNGDLEKWTGGPNGGEVWLYSYHNGGHWPMDLNRHLIWNFCKRFSLNKTAPIVSITSPKGGGMYYSYAPQGEATFPDITIEASAYDPNGTISQVDFYDNNTLIATVTAEPYKATLSGATAGIHTLKVVATDNDGETGSTSAKVTLSAPQAAVVLSSKFTEANSVPAGWVTYDSDEKRIGYVGGFSQGCRILQMTGSPRDFTYGLYIRNKNGQAHQGYAKYGLPEANSSIILARGHYTLKYRICNWNREEFSKVEVAVEKLDDGQAVAQVEYMPTVNVGNVTSNSFSGSKQETFEFDVYEGGNYVLAIYSDASGWSDALIGYLSLAYSGEPVTAITTVTAADSPDRIYNLNGQAIANPSKGIFIKNGKKVVLK
ncbi:MAG: hypothetical protein IJP74_11815 [Prevotella sp.]|nr:hypothetical protein [Prevotella sp.]